MVQSEDVSNVSNKVMMLPEFPHIYRKPVILESHPTFLPSYMYQLCPKVLLISIAYF